MRQAAPQASDEADGEATAPKARVRSPNLDVARVAAIVRIVHGLPGKVSWMAVMSAAEARLGAQYTRQALFAHAAIRLAYQERKSGASVRPGERPVSERARAAAAAVAGLRARLAEVGRREEALLERVARWTYNAHANGIPIALLDAKLGETRAEAAGLEAGSPPKQRRKASAVDRTRGAEAPPRIPEGA